jgi:hypothetical protein
MAVAVVNTVVELMMMEMVGVMILNKERKKSDCDGGEGLAAA